MTQSGARRRIKVLAATDAVRGGVRTHLSLLLEHLPRDRFEVHLAVPVARDADVQCYEQWRGAGCRVHELPLCGNSPLPRYPMAFLALLALCRRERFDVVHTHCARAGILGRLAGRFTGAWSVHTPHVFPFDRGVRPLVESVYLRLEKLAARWTDRLVLLSRYQMNQVVRHALWPAGRIHVVPNGVDWPDAPADRRGARQALGLPGDVAVAVAVGRLCLQKCHDVLLEAAALARASAGRAFRLLLVGSGELAGRLRARIRSQGLGDMVVQAGSVRDPAPYYAAADVVLLPSRFEGMPYVLLEAKAAARPVAVSLCSGMEEFVRHGVDGFLLPPGDAEAWARVLVSACEEPERLHEAGAEARRGFKARWGARVVADTLGGIYEEVAGGKGRSAVSGTPTGER